MIEKGSHTTESDQSLLDALIKGEETAFEKIYKSYFALLQNYSASIVGDSEAALEIIQNIFVALWENRKNLDREQEKCRYCPKIRHFRPDSRNHPLPGNEKTSGKNKKIVFSNT